MTAAYKPINLTWKNNSFNPFLVLEKKKKDLK